MRQKENFGKKPVRRSKSETNESAKVYRPRTAKKTSSEPSEESTPIEQEPRKEYQRKDDAQTDGSENQRGDKKVLKRKSGGESYQPKTGSRGKSDSQTYQPRTFRKSNDEKDFPKKDIKLDKHKDFEKSSNEEPKKSYYEEKFSKPSTPKRERISDDKSDKTPKPILRKAIRTEVTPPEIVNELKTDNDGLIRLNKYVANSGLCSRREADEYIAKGLITVNGIEITELGTKVKLTDEICFKGKVLDPEKKVYILLNKPKDYITTVEDPNAKRTVMDLIEGACSQRVYPVGRLDRNSTGLLLLTNDGEMTKRLTHPSFMKKKVYEVGLDKAVKPEDMDAIRKGIEIEGETISADAIEYIDPNDPSEIGIEIHSGQNRIVRRIFEALNYRVIKLDRVYFAGLTKNRLPRGKWRFLNQKEVDMLKMNRFE